MQSNPPSRERRSPWRDRFVAVATLVAFLVAQPWIVCAPLCLLKGHAQVASVALPSPDRVIHCHSDSVMRSELPSAQPLGSMLPVEVGPLLLPLQIVAV
ncbi:MAG: hypothetical protein ACJ8BF_03350, partial [Gemmatimonadales bacterium]